MSVDSPITPKKEEKKAEKVKDKGIYVGVDDEFSEEDPRFSVEDEELSDIWKEMNFALESSKVLLCWFYTCAALLQCVSLIFLLFFNLFVELACNRLCSFFYGCCC